MADSSSKWNQFWFQPSTCHAIARVRILSGITSALLLLSWLNDLPNWIGNHDILSQTSTRTLIQLSDGSLGSFFRFSPLYYLTDASLIQSYLATGILSSLLLAIGIGGRIVAGTTWFFVLSVCHRIPMLTGAAEPLLSAVLLYLIIDQGKTLNWKTPGVCDGGSRLTANIATRLIQIHLWAWLLMSVLNQLASSIWWQGDAAWWLAIAERSWLSPDQLYGHPFWINALTHGTILCQFAALTLLLRSITRPLGLVAVSIFWLAVVVLSCDWLYALVGFSASLAFWPGDSELVRPVA